MEVEFETSIGRCIMEINLEYNRFYAENFLNLCALAFYDKCPFYLIQKEFMALSGDPSGTGKEGTKSFYELRDKKEPEFVSFNNKHVSDQARSVGLLLSSKRKKLGAHFFLMLKSGFDIKKNYPLIGRVVNSEFIDHLNQVKTDLKGIPIEPVWILRTLVRDSTFKPDPIPIPEKTAYNSFIAQKSISKEIPELTEIPLRKEIIDLALEKNKPIDVDEALKTKSLWIGGLNPASRPEEVKKLMEERFTTKLVSFLLRNNYMIIELESLEKCDEVYEVIKRGLIIDDYKLRVDYSFKELKRFKSS